ncbi:MAG TPA: Hint domain-containing protein [Myxococcaceae bacterium]|nr:Hint domain-containing protein [Myxococcaceae bacterium]
MPKSRSVLWKPLYRGLLAGLLWPLAVGATSLDKQGVSQEIDWHHSEFSGTSQRGRLSPAEWKTYREDRAHVRTKYGKPDGSASLDWSDPRAFRFVIARLKLAGKTPQTSPRLFEKIQQRRAEHQRGQFLVSTTAGNTRKAQHYMTSTNIIEGSNHIEANATVTYPGGAYYLYVDSASWDNTGEPLGPMGYMESYGGATARSAAIGDIEQTAAQHFELDSYSLMDTSIGLLESFTFRDNNKSCEFDLSTLAIQAPVDRRGGQCISICLNRTWTNDCDYDLTSSPNALVIPLKGSISISERSDTCVFDLAKIEQFRAGTLTSGFIKIALPGAGGGCDLNNGGSANLSMKTFWQNTTLTNGNRTLSWDMTGSNSAVFDASCRMVQDTVDLTMAITLPMKKGEHPVAPRPIVISNDPNSQATDYTLACMTMVNSCVAAGTRISMGDGKSQAIETLAIGAKVYNPYTQTMLVRDTAQGFETSPMVRIKDEAGRNLLMTELHPILSVDRGFVQAKALKVGDRVETITGPSRLVSVTREQFNGKVYNLEVGSDAERLKLGPDETVMYAEGFVIADKTIQEKYEALARAAAAKFDVREHLPKAWLRDFKNSATRR